LVATTKAVRGWNVFEKRGAEERREWKGNGENYKRKLRNLNC
jgi:hypothetical protein